MLRYTIVFFLLFIFVGSAQATTTLAFGEEPQVGKAYRVTAKTTQITGTRTKLKWYVSELGSHVAMGQLPIGTKLLLMHNKKSIIVVLVASETSCCKYQIGLSQNILKAFSIKNPKAWKGSIRIIVLPGNPIRLTESIIKKGIPNLGPTSTYEDPEKIQIQLH